jgi:hypothetical protein
MKRLLNLVSHLGKDSFQDCQTKLTLSEVIQMRMNTLKRLHKGRWSTRELVRLC